MTFYIFPQVITIENAWSRENTNKKADCVERRYSAEEWVWKEYGWFKLLSSRKLSCAARVYQESGSVISLHSHPAMHFYIKACLSQRPLVCR